jgi:transposase
MIFSRVGDNNTLLYCKRNYAAYVKLIMPYICSEDLKRIFISLLIIELELYSRKCLTRSLFYGIIYLTLFKKEMVIIMDKHNDDQKSKTLAQQGALNPRPDCVKDPLFKESDFFDPRDLVQVKYEMIRRVHTDRQTVAGAANAFGFSRPSFYQAQSALAKEGLSGLIPKKRGPRTRHKLTDEVMGYIEGLCAEDATVSAKELVKRILGRFGLKVHQRSIERALERRKKKH